METPSSRLTRSQALASIPNANNLPVSSEKWRERKQHDRCALFDISNNSPIVGLAKGMMETPSSEIVKQRTPGSGEALLRCQVKTLLLKVEEEAHLSKLVPMGLLPPTPANTPHLSALVTIASPVVEQRLVSQVINEILDGEFEKSVITRSLLLDFSEKCESKEEEDEDNASVWSTEVNGSAEEEEEEEEEIVDAVCEGIQKMSVRVSESEGKHTRFVYDSEDELVGGDEVLRFKGLPTPKGKHMRFREE